MTNSSFWCRSRGGKKSYYVVFLRNIWHSTVYTYVQYSLSPVCNQKRKQLKLLQLFKSFSHCDSDWQLIIVGHIHQSSVKNNSCNLFHCAANTNVNVHNFFDRITPNLLPTLPICESCYGGKVFFACTFLYMCRCLSLQVQRILASTPSMKSMPVNWTTHLSLAAQL